MADNEKRGSGDYDIGYGKPPKQTQFQPGQSGNPRGRPKGRANIQSILEKRLYQKTKMKIGGEVQNVTVIDAAIMRLIQQLMQGAPEIVISILKFALPMLSVNPEPMPVHDLSKLTDEELHQLERIMVKLEGSE